MMRLSSMVRIAAFGAILLLAGGAQSQPRAARGGNEEAEAGPEEGIPALPAVMIGMEAYREVILSGEYLVGPGDHFLFYMSDVEDPVDVRVLAEGGLFVPRVGRVQVGGVRLREARRAILEAFQRKVRVGEVSVELSELRQFPISVTGVVSFPGVRVASGVERVSEVLRKAGGLGATGSERDIRLIKGSSLSPEARPALESRLRSGDLTVLDSIDVPYRRVDLGLYKATGKTGLNPFVEDGDIIVVPPRRDVIQALEAWERSGIFEYAPGDRITELVTLAMGPASHCDPENVYLFRYVDDGGRQEQTRVDIEAALGGDEKANLPLRPGDWLVARPRPDFQQASTVRLLGEVVYPGLYVVDASGTPLADVITRAGGFTPLASLPEARVVRPLKEEPKDPEFERIAAIPPPSWSEEERQYFNMKRREKRGQMVVDFAAVFAEGDTTQNILLLPGDQVAVPTSQYTVLVSGQAASPGAIPYDASYGVWDYIARAGGFGWRASKEVIVIKARTGERIRAEEVVFLEPGDRIWIKETPEHDYWQLITETMIVAGQVATVVLLFVTILR